MRRMADTTRTKMCIKAVAIPDYLTDYVAVKAIWTDVGRDSAPMIWMLPSTWAK